MKNKIEDLRNHLFATLEALQDEEKPMEIARAKAIADVAQTIINSAKVEVDFLQATGQKRGSAFLDRETRPALPAGNGMDAAGE
jgi:hypothetical protein